MLMPLPAALQLALTLLPLTPRCCCWWKHLAVGLALYHPCHELGKCKEEKHDVIKPSFLHPQPSS
jgi:hypothetical protein